MCLVSLVQSFWTAEKRILVLTYWLCFIYMCIWFGGSKCLLFVKIVSHRIWINKGRELCKTIFNPVSFFIFFKTRTVTVLSWWTHVFTWWTISPTLCAWELIYDFFPYLSRHGCHCDLRCGDNVHRVGETVHWVGEMEKWFSWRHVFIKLKAGLKNKK